MSVLSTEQENPGDRFLKEDAAMRTRSPARPDAEPALSSFATSARSGRRNALPDIRGSVAIPGTPDTPSTPGACELQPRLESLSVKDDVPQKSEEATCDQLENPKEEEK